MTVTSLADRLLIKHTPGGHSHLQARHGSRYAMYREGFWAGDLGVSSYDGLGGPEPSSEAERYAIGQYTASWSNDINQTLRNGASRNEQLSAEWAKTNRPIIDGYVGHLDNYLGRSSLPRDAVLYRLAGAEWAKDLKPGQTFRDKGFVSASANPAKAKSYLPKASGGNGGLKDSAHVYIRAPKGSKAAGVRGLSWAGSHFTDDEAEVLFARNTKFRVVRTSWTPTSGAPRKGVGYVELEVLPE